MEVAAWKTTCSNEDCDWHNQHSRKPSVQYRTCPWCDDENIAVEPYAVPINDVGDLLEELEKKEDQFPDSTYYLQGMSARAGFKSAIKEMRQRLEDIAEKTQGEEQ